MKIKLSEAIKLIESKTGKKVTLKEAKTPAPKKMEAKKDVYFTGQYIDLFKNGKEEVYSLEDIIAKIKTVKPIVAKGQVIKKGSMEWDSNFLFVKGKHEVWFSPADIENYFKVVQAEKILKEAKVEFKIGDKVKLKDGFDKKGKLVVREYTVSKPGMRSSNNRIKEDEVYLTAPGTIGFDANIDWLVKNKID